MVQLKVCCSVSLKVLLKAAHWEPKMAVHLVTKKAPKKASNLASLKDWYLAMN